MTTGSAPRYYRKGDLPPGGRTLFPPREGWEAHTLYLVRVAYSKANVIHESFLMVGFLDDKGEPAGYSEIWNNTYDGPEQFGKYHFLEVVRKLHSVDE